MRNDILLTVFCAWLAAQLIKAAIEFWFTRRITWRVLFGMGGMPSSPFGLSHFAQYRRGPPSVSTAHSLP
ncbi:MAG: divergent PAP2 family protein [Anaerolineae bacterium]|nr:divergent PAP2 family protein [Anaerolineae bacterium]